MTPSARLASDVVRVQVWYATVMVVLAVAYATVAVARPGLVVAIVLVSVTAIELGVRRQRPQRAGAWRLLEAAVAVLGLHSFLVLVEDDSAGTYPAGSDLVVLAGFVLLGVALFRLGRPTAPQREETGLIDAVTLTLAGSLPRRADRAGQRPGLGRDDLVREGPQAWTR
jgi:hypothetical protein